ncbi:NitT/TauT family transport system permease protein [Ruminococcus sp. YE71]|uniref:ABC transporter permease n=1 Tax=unclassified Ruminococcus TaxID=2608920 RepID=UPI000889B42C|nr:MULTISPECIES: ABC transporter permease [unclassified Ruminococcus]SDA24276.1 NitT/TauT family transport system permease protein [Ruminococcus sp. YE78]SFW41748.1 NitT/TauT family transport system permease protein [Ruminococcus sp. YE71]
MSGEIAIRGGIQTPVKKDTPGEKPKTVWGYRHNGYYALKVLFTISGFIAAIITNIVFPQKAAVEIKTYILSGFGLNISLNMNDAYIFVLTALILIYLISGIRSISDKAKRKLYCKNAAFRFALGIALAVWDIGGTKLQVFAQPFFPGPAQVIEAYLSDSTYIVQNTLYSLRLYAAGFSCGVLLGVGTGILIGWFPKVYYWVFPILKITGVVPAVAWMPFALTLLPTSFTAAVFLIVICAWFQIAFLTAQGIQSTPKQNYEAARILGSSQLDLIFHVAIPHAMPDIFTGITSANAMAFTTLVMSEMLGQPGGLGYYINQSKVWSAYYKVLAAIVIMAILFSLINHFIGLVQKRTLRWQEGVVKK